MPEKTTSRRRRSYVSPKILYLAAVFCVSFRWIGRVDAYLPSVIRQDGHRTFQSTARRTFGHGRCVRFASTHQQSNDNTSNGSTAASSCPFSMTFRRYKIDLTTERRQKPKDDNSPFAFLEKLSPFSSPRETKSKPKSSSTVNDPRQVKKWQQKLYTQQDRQNSTPLFVLSDSNGVAVMNWLWERTAVLMKDADNTGMILVLPDTSKLVVQNFVEIVEWMASSEEVSRDISCRIRASIMEEAEVPAIRLERQVSPPPANTVDQQQPSEDTINKRTKKWVRRILVEQGICPFTKSDKMSGQGLSDLGVPVGSIAYHTSYQQDAIGLFADTWKAILDMIEAGPNGREGGVSSILLAAPAFDDDFEYWAGPIFAMLEASVVAAQAEAEIGVVCFHPKYATPDGTTFPGFGHMHSVPRLQKWYQEYEENMRFARKEATTLSDLDTESIAAGGAWQRRTPHATINVLRADQLEVAESRRESAKMYTENIEKLVGANGIGNEKLADDLETERQMGSSR